jgi:hypothetical protein
MLVIALQVDESLVQQCWFDPLPPNRTNKSLGTSGHMLSVAATTCLWVEQLLPPNARIAFLVVSGSRLNSTDLPANQALSAVTHLNILDCISDEPMDAIVTAFVQQVLALAKLIVQNCQREYARLAR